MFCITSLGSLYLEGHIFGILLYAGFIVVECLICTNVFTSMHIIFKKKMSSSSAGALQGLYRVNIFSPFQFYEAY